MKTLLTTKLKPRRAGLPAEGVSRIDLITEQSRWWVSADGQWHDISKIDADYRSALIFYFVSNARRIHRVYLRRLAWTTMIEAAKQCDLYSDFEPEMLDEALGKINAVRALTPRQWMARQPLLCQLRVLARTS